MFLKLEQIQRQRIPLSDLSLGNLVALSFEISSLTNSSEMNVFRERLFTEIGKKFCQVHLQVDALEQEEMISIADALGFRTIRMNIGDMGIPDLVAFERKGSDYLSSVFSYKIFQQLHEMKESYQFSFLVVDRPLEDIIIEGLRHNISEYNTLATVASFMVRGFVPLFCSSKEQLAQICKLVCMKVNDGKDRSKYSPVRKKREASKEEIGINILCGLPGVGEEMAKKLLERFKNPIDVFNATEEELQEVEGIGAKRAKEIFESIR